MDLVALAIPFFLLALIAELAVDRYRGSGLYRANDAINSLSAGILSTTIGYFTKFLPLLVWGFVLENFALVDMPMAWFDLSPRGLLLWIGAALAWDFCYYWFHRYSHEISVLWAAHAVHHQSEDYNLSTALRQTSTGFLFGWIFYLPLFLLGFPLEVLLTVNAINLIYQFWVHTQVVDRLGPLDYVLVTPSNHRVHHAQNERYIDKNYGGMLILWDRVFGTFEDEREDDPVIYGVPRPLTNWNPFWANVQVYDYLLKDARKTRRWRDKFATWFGRTGWRPPDVATSDPAHKLPLDAFAKYDPEVAPVARRYALVQFAVAVVATLAIGQQFAANGLAAVAIPCLLLWAQLYSIGLMNEGREGSQRRELLRLALVNPLGVLAMQAAGDAGGWSAWAGLAAYTAVSLTLLISKKDNKSIS